MVNNQNDSINKSGTDNAQPERLHLQVLNKTFELLTTALSLVAALAWNDAIQSLFSKIFGNADSLWAKFAYALLVTAIVVWLGTRAVQTQKILNKLGNPKNN